VLLRSLTYPLEKPHQFEHGYGRHLNARRHRGRSGHHDVAFTLRTYAHLLPGMHSEAMNAIGNLIFGSSATENVTSGVT
jgi:hypothetical protein